MAVPHAKPQCCFSTLCWCISPRFNGSTAWQIFQDIISVDAIHFLQASEAPVTAVKQVHVYIRLRFLQWQIFGTCGYKCFGRNLLLLIFKVFRWSSRSFWNTDNHLSDYTVRCTNTKEHHMKICIHLIILHDRKENTGTTKQSVLNTNLTCASSSLFVSQVHCNQIWHIST